MMTKKAQVVMLPTDKSNLAIIKETNKLVIADNNHHFAKGDRSEDYLTPQHLYFTTDDEIKQNDWGILIKKIEHIGLQIGDLYQNAHGPIGSVMGDAAFIANHFRKIVATTNKELWLADRIVNNIAVSEYLNVPKIPTDFIEAYVREQGRIKEVMLECEDTFNDFANEGFKGIELPKIWKPKLRPNGTVIIHPVKPVTYSAEEFRKAIQMAFNDGANWAYNAKIYTSLTSGDPIPSEDYFNKHYNNQ